MRTLLIILVLGLSVYGTAQAATIMVIGDSISAAYGLDETDGWVDLAENELSKTIPDVELVNVSISGDTTEGGLRRLPAALERFNPDVLIIELGGNDGLRGYSLNKIRENLITMAKASQDAGAQVLILGMRIPSNYGPAYTEKFAQTFVDAATDTDSELVPFFMEPIAMDASYFQPDGIHPTAAAQPLLLQPVIEKLLPMLESVATEGQ